MKKENMESRLMCDNLFANSNANWDINRSHHDIYHITLIHQIESV